MLESPARRSGQSSFVRLNGQKSAFLPFMLHILAIALKDAEICFRTTKAVSCASVDALMEQTRVSSSHA